MNLSAEGVSPILHVVVVGFHHKKGCQVRKLNDVRRLVVNSLWAGFVLRFNLTRYITRRWPLRLTGSSLAISFCRIFTSPIFNFIAYTIASNITYPELSSWQKLEEM